MNFNMTRVTKIIVFRRNDQYKTRFNQRIILVPTWMLFNSFSKYCSVGFLDKKKCIFCLLLIENRYIDELK